MEFSFHIQDPSNADTVYLYEALVGQIRKGNLSRWRGIFAFATAEAVRNIFREDPDIAHFVRDGEVELIVGLDAITNESALAELKELDDSLEKFRARVFHNTVPGLFHPKIAHFSFGDGRSALIVGSGNFTPGGLRKNIEAFSIISGTDAELASLKAWDDFVALHGEHIRAIDDDAIERARQNKFRGGGARGKQRVSTEEQEEEVSVAEDEVAPGARSRVLVAEVPAAGGRWHQIHYNKEVVRRFFRVAENSSQRVFLREVDQRGRVGAEEIRPLIYSGSNKNLKIEIAGRRHEPYPEAGPKPILVIREVGTRSFLYLLLMPGETGFADMERLLADFPSIGKGVRRVITDSDELRRRWDACPLSTT